MANDTCVRQQGAAKPGTQLALDEYLLSKTKEVHCSVLDLLHSLLRAVPTRQVFCIGHAWWPRSLKKSWARTLSTPEKPGEGAEKPPSPYLGKPFTLSYKVLACCAHGPACLAPGLLWCVFLSAGTKIPSALFSAFLTLSGNSCSNFNTRLLPEVRTRVSDSEEKTKIFMLSNLIYLEISLLEPASFIQVTSQRKKKLKRKK